MKPLPSTHRLDPIFRASPYFRTDGPISLPGLDQSSRKPVSGWRGTAPTNYLLIDLRAGHVSRRHRAGEAAHDHGITPIFQNLHPFRLDAHSTRAAIPRPFFHPSIPEDLR